MPGYVFKDHSTKHQTGDEQRLKVDYGLYSDIEAPKGGLLDPSTIRLFAEHKLEVVSQDPWSDYSAVFDASDVGREESRGEVLQYADNLFTRSHRTWLFGLLVLSTHVRFLYFERAGIVVSEKFDYVKDPTKLVEFLWRFSQLTPEQQGIDTTAVPARKGDKDGYHNLMTEVAKVKPGEDEEEAVLAYLTEHNEFPPVTGYVRQYFADSLKDDWPRYLLTVDGKKFLVGKPHFFTDGLVGRGTRGYVALEISTMCFYFLKDTWRADCANLVREGTILEKLNKAGVKFIPTFECHGDVGEQRTRAHDLWSERSGPLAYPAQDDESEDGTVDEVVHAPKPHSQLTHYRLVVREVARPMKDVSSGRDFVNVMRLCLTGKQWIVLGSPGAGVCIGHKDAYKKAHILHRDVSAGNVLLYPCFVKRAGGVRIVNTGLMADWEFSRDLKVKEKGQPGRTVTLNTFARIPSVFTDRCPGHVAFPFRAGRQRRA